MRKLKRRILLITKNFTSVLSLLLETVTARTKAVLRQRNVCVRMLKANPVMKSGQVISLKLKPLLIQLIMTVIISWLQ